MAELAAKLAHRQAVNEGETEAKMRSVPKNVYTEFDEFTRKEIKEYEKIFKKYDVDNNQVIDQFELQKLMEKLEAPQTHVALRQMIAEVDEDGDKAISFREFLLIFRKARLGELATDSGLGLLYANIAEIDVDETGVGGAAKFFEAKVAQVNAGSKFEQEIRQEQEERKKQEEEKRRRKAEFKARAQSFESI